jgi:transcription-repair coupling factor (superfamily II helicase)
MSSLDSFAWQLTQLSAQAKRPLLIITIHQRELNRLTKSIRFFNPSTKVLPFLDWETLPYEHLSPAHTKIMQRLQTLSQLKGYSEGIIITTVAALLQRLAPKDYITAYAFDFTVSGKVDITQLGEQLAHCGYQRVTTVTLPGEFAVRGALIDIFPLNTKLPFRIHTDRYQIENLYYFDPNNQQPSAPINSISILPTREFPCSEDSITRFRQQGYQLLGQRFLDSVICNQLSINSYTAGTEYYLPLFFEKTNTLLDYLPRHTHWVTKLDLEEEILNRWQYITDRYEQLHSNIQWPILVPEKLYQPPEELLLALQSFKSATVKSFLISELPDLCEADQKQPLKKLQHFLSTLTTGSTTPPQKILFCSARLSQQETLIKKLSENNIATTNSTHWYDFLEQKNSFQVSVTPIHTGFCIPSQNLFIIPDTALYSYLYTPPSSQKNNLNSPQPVETFNSLTQLTLHDPVVHIDHGIGLYLGLQRLAIDQQAEEEFIVLAYANNTKLYVPIQDIRHLSCYTGHTDPILNHLNSSSWKKTKQKALIQLKDSAAELLALYAQRAQVKTEAYNHPNADYEAFANSFEYEETKDQKTAIFQIINDLCNEQPMDRLVCGDVGFGKTEVAMRAAFLAVQSEKQVAILAPTTLLVEQHYRNFRERFADWPITIDWLSRFRSSADHRTVKQSLKTGEIDIIIGTHTLLGRQVEFKSLGLLIIDEEHHFGVQQKERLKILKTQINVLTLTATPIPRTLQTALAGLRELSLITTPPAGRLSIKNFVSPRNTSIIQEAIVRELLRGGQIYFVHNRIASLARVAREIHHLIPQAKIGIAHGQLPEEELETCMEAFYQQQTNILICTSIIETGLDIPTANTLIVDRADHFGLAQLHQLRGRVGRSHHQAYAYFLVSDEAHLTQDAQKRLEALKSLAELGSGFNLASQDLDIRGAGELLGDRQSGALQGMGFSLYMELFHKTIEAMKAGKELTDLDTVHDKTKISLQVSAFIPEHYLPDIPRRLQYYQKISNAKNAQDLEQVQVELLDQYGILPQETKNLFAITALKQTAAKLGIEKIEANKKGGWLEFYESSQLNLDRIIHLMQTEPKYFKLTPNTAKASLKLSFSWGTCTKPSQSIQWIRDLLERLRS